MLDVKNFRFKKNGMDFWRKIQSRYQVPVPAKPKSGPVRLPHILWHQMRFHSDADKKLRFLWILLTLFVQDFSKIFTDKFSHNSENYNFRSIRNIALIFQNRRNIGKTSCESFFTIYVRIEIALELKSDF